MYYPVRQQHVSKSFSYVQKTFLVVIDGVLYIIVIIINHHHHHHNHNGMNQFKIKICNLKNFHACPVSVILFQCRSLSTVILCVPCFLPCILMMDEYSCPCLPSNTPFSFFLCSLFCQGLLSICITECFVYPLQDVNGIFLYLFLALQRLNST